MFITIRMLVRSDELMTCYNKTKYRFCSKGFFWNYLYRNPQSQLAVRVLSWCVPGFAIHANRG